MVQFIKQEASEKAREIAIATEEEFNIEKLSMVDSEKIKIAKEYERKELTVDIAKKIEASTSRNAMRLKVLAARDAAMREVLDEARERLAGTSANASAYEALLETLIVQGAKKIKEPVVRVRCRESDRAIVREAISRASTSLIGVSVELDANVSLAAAPACSGGVEVASASGKIVCDNTLDARLRMAYEHATPEIRASMFGEGAKIR